MVNRKWETIPNDKASTRKSALPLEFLSSDHPLVQCKHHQDRHLDEEFLSVDKNELMDHLDDVQLVFTTVERFRQYFLYASQLFSAVPDFLLAS